MINSKKIINFYGVKIRDFKKKNSAPIGIFIHQKPFFWGLKDLFWLEKGFHLNPS